MNAPPAWTEALPTLNATLNAVCAVLLVAGWINVRRGALEAHKRCMLSAVAVSAAFLTSYLLYHYLHGSTRYQGRGAARTLYFAILISHTILAMVNLPLILATLYLALKGRLERHKRVARIALPIWIYVSVTGVVVYWMLYRM